MNKIFCSFLIIVIVLSGCMKENNVKVDTSQKEDPKKEEVNQVKVVNGNDIILENEKALNGNIKVLKNFTMNSLQRERNIWIYLPPSYDSSDKRFPVFYMQDGQSIFKSDNTEWMVDETLQEFVKTKTTDEIIVVGIESDSATRFDEYAPWKNPVGDGGEGDKYVDFIVKELKPYIDANFKTLNGREHTGIAGGSMGGYISLYAAIKYQDVFSKVLAFSPIFGFNKSPYIEFINKVGIKEDIQIYLDAGEKEEEFPLADKDVKEMGELLVNAGMKEQKLKLVIDPNGTHRKESWQTRFPEAFKWIMNQ
jgi:predicted alpha/beta superfamily hydrolase